MMKNSTRATRSRVTKTASAKSAAPSKGKAQATKASDSDKENKGQRAAISTARTKRKRDEPDAPQGDTNNAKRVKTSSAPPRSAKASAPKKNGVRAKRAKPIKKINEAPTEPMDIFVFGEGAGGELGLGSKEVNDQQPYEVMRPRLNPLLSSKDVGVVQMSCGGLHGVAITKDNKILTWGVNDHGALGRDTNVEEDDDDLLNPAESTPGPIDTSGLDPDIKWAQVVGLDNASFALTEDGKVYGWGTFRGREGVTGFRAITKPAEIQKTICLIPELKNIVQLAAGTNHILALDNKGKVYAWGCGEQGQIGRVVPAYRPESALKPEGIGRLPKRGAKAVKVACGSYHSFIIDQQGRVFAWGLNNLGELAIPDQAGENDAHETRPRFVEALSQYKIVDIIGGQHHSLAVTDDGKLLAWGRIDGHQVGLAADTFTEENTIFDEHGRPRILIQPTVVPNIPPVVAVTAGGDHSLVLTAEGKAYSWGFSSSGRTGLGTEDDVEIPTLINSKSVRDRELIFADAGGPFSVLGAIAGNAG
ncbi:RCC1/BLIP-II [Hypomontagnella monticulosa]|nr:RCC1/BLIP-II [Hypomontagnella monticulosa]